MDVMLLGNIWLMPLGDFWHTVAAGLGYRGRPLKGKGDRAKSVDSCDEQRVPRSSKFSWSYPSYVTLPWARFSRCSKVFLDFFWAQKYYCCLSYFHELTVANL